MTTSRCLAWHLSDTNMERYLENGPKFYPPLRCKELCVGTEVICASHLKKKLNPPSNMNKNRSGAYWGLVTEPIRNFGDGKNYIALSPWFMEKAKQYPLSEDKMRKLKAQFAAATEAVPNAPALPVVSTSTPETTVPVPAKRSRKKKEVSAEVVPVTIVKEVEVSTKVVPVSIVKEVEVSAKAVPVEKKKRQLRKVQTLPSEALPIAGIVVNSKPLEVEDFHEVHVRVFEHSGTRYYLDPKKQKLYDRAADGSTKGLYKGRWDSVAESIVTTIPDSDSEE